VLCAPVGTSSVPLRKTRGILAAECASAGIEIASAGTKRASAVLAFCLLQVLKVSRVRSFSLGPHEPKWQVTRKLSFGGVRDSRDALSLVTLLVPALSVIQRSSGVWLGGMRQRFPPQPHPSPPAV
jgi:hypothetical protein